MPYGAGCSGALGPPAGLAMMMLSTRSTVMAASAASLSASFLVASRSSTPQSPALVGLGLGLGSGLGLGLRVEG